MTPGDDPAAPKREERGASHQSDDVGSASPSPWKADTTQGGWRPIETAPGNVA